MSVADTKGDATLLKSPDNGIHWDTLAVWPYRFGPNRPIYNQWYQFLEVDTILVAAAVAVYTTGGDYYLFRSLDGGLTWIDTVNGVWHPRLLYAGSCIYAFNDGISILSSTDCGATWDTVKLSGLPSDFDFVGAVACRDTLMFCGTGDGIFRSSSFGQSWESVSLLPRIGWTAGLEFIGDTLFWLRGHQDYTVSVLRSTDNGTTWSNASSGLSGGSRGSTFWRGGGYLFTATSTGLFVSTNRGDSWRLWGGGLPYNASPYLAANSMAFSDSFAFAASGGGVWRRPLSELATSVQQLSDQGPQSFELSQNYPNPFNPSTNITYTLPKASLVKLSVFDILGREVSVLVNEKKDAGVHEVKFDGSNLASGVYFYRLQAGDFVQARKLVILR